MPATSKDDGRGSRRTCWLVVEATSFDSDSRTSNNPLGMASWSEAGATRIVEAAPNRVTAMTFTSSPVGADGIGFMTRTLPGRIAATSESGLENVREEEVAE